MPNSIQYHGTSIGLILSIFYLPSLQMNYGNKYNEPCEDAYEYFSRGNFKKLLGDYPGALLDYNKTIEMKPSFFEAYYQRGVVKSLLKDEDGAMSDFNKAIDLILNSI
jgi:tetratricopeptide (TPR) repeat protein